MSENLVDGDYGTSRVRNGMPGSLPSGLLTPTMDCILSIHWGLCTLGNKLKIIDE